MNRSLPFSPDILNMVSGPKKVEMLQLIHKFNSQQIQIPEFLSTARMILGQKIYNQMVSTMNQIHARNTQILHNQRLASVDILPQLRPTSDFSMTSMPLVTPEREYDTIPQPESNQADVSKMDADSLQDILQYSGINLKEEAENILREQEQFIVNLGQEQQEDSRGRAESLFDIDILTELVGEIGSRYGLSKDIDPRVYELCLYGVQSRFAHILDALVMISRNRVDVLRAHFKMRIENDPKRQLAILDMILTERNRKYLSKSDDDHQGSPKKPKTVQSPIGSPSLAPSNLSTLEREDLYIKTRITNATALNQLGIPIKNWMLEGSAATSSAMMINPPKPSKVEKNLSTKPISPRAFGSHSPAQHPSMAGISDKEWRSSVFNRKIITKDLVFFMEHDQRLCHSDILARTHIQ